MRTFLRLMTFLRPYRSGVIWSIVLAALAMAGTVAIPALTGRAIDAVRAGDRSELHTLAWALGGVAVLRLVFSVFRRLVSGRVSLGVELHLREHVLGHLQRLELGFFDGQQTGQLMSRSTVDLQSIRFFLGYGLVFIIQSALSIVLAAIAMLLTSWWLGLLALIPVPFVVWIAFRFGRRSRPALQEVQQRIGELTADVEENVSGVRVVKAFAREGQQLERFRGRALRVFDQSMAANRIRAFYTPFIGFLPQLGLAIVLIVGGRAAVSGSITLGQFTAFYAYVLMLVNPMRQLGISLGMAQRATASGARIFELLDRAPDPPEDPTAVPLPDGPGRIELRGVTLRYRGARRAALTDVSLTVPGGTSLALVGATGSGKSSLVSLIPRLYEAETGTVLVDGVDVRTVQPGSLRREIATVSDDPFLFSATVRENIAYAKPDATDAEVRRAAERAQAAGFIDALPEGMNTKVGERGLTLSGGQRQRLAIARALLAEPRILILDDATSSVDATTEQAVKAALREVMAGRTTIVIAHRISTLELADEIVVLDAGRITARGTHAELLAEAAARPEGDDGHGAGLYAEIVRRGMPDDLDTLQRARATA